MRSITLKSTGTTWVLAPGAEASFRAHDVLVIRDVPDGVTDASAVHTANQTLINTPAQPKDLVTVAFDRLGAGKVVNLVIGRPPGSTGPRLSPENATKPRSVRLNDERWEKLQQLGRDWLEQKIDAAKLPAD